MCLCGSFLPYPKGIFTFSPSREYYKPNTNIKTQVQWPGLRIISPIEFAPVVSCFCLVFLINVKCFLIFGVVLSSVNENTYNSLLHV